MFDWEWWEGKAIKGVIFLFDEWGLEKIGERGFIFVWVWDFGNVLKYIWEDVGFFLKYGFLLKRYGVYFVRIRIIIFFDVEDFYKGRWGKFG